MVAQPSNTLLTILRRAQLEKSVALSRSTIYERINPKSPSYDPTFPKPISLGTPGMKKPPVGWLEHEVIAWIEAQAAKRGCAK